MRSRHTLFNVLDNLLRQLGTRVVVRQHDVVCQVLCNFAHQWPLAAIPITAATKHAPQCAAGMWTQCTECMPQCIGCVGVIHNDHRSVLAVTETFHTSWHRG